MNCMWTLLLTRELSAGRGTALWAASKKNLLRLKRSSCLQNSRLVPVRSIQVTKALGTTKSPVTPSVKDNKEQDQGKESPSRSLVTAEDLFERVSRGIKTKATFQEAVDIFCKHDIRRRGHVEFIYAALKKMPEFGVERDISVYNKILDVFPKEVFVPRNYIQRMFNHYPKQQECGIEVLEQMENYGIMPNKETKFLLLRIFGEKSHPIRKYQRLMYWFPKFKNINPYPVPDPLPQDPVDLARLSLQRIAADLDAKVTVYQFPHVEILDSGKSTDHPHIVGIQSPDQQSFLASHNPGRPIFVEGPFRLWLKRTCVYYYVLRAELLPPEERKEKVIDPERNFYYPMYLDIDLERDLLDDEEFDIDEVEEGPVFAMCIAGAGDQATLAKWIVGLQETNPILCQIPVVFRLAPGPRELQSSTSLDENREEEMAQARHLNQEF
ncbi:evolutionarily conserved signaling intermediate in Toll pathway, mitochondrial [Hemicordylus capensis]|uniref:evolutionarily conserved signaling intermediate in Toll pathway, mitochondrial n=1 Tax=Hemicordylus capensis TaxID=884348 RepID=UPI002303272E|nr:evolutionarily conserved signaling intermediate in Toll pathway, mitochondrial [Hemicordylus capensis]XP_053151364.1 evolutionarily conserved signaling intermediate in Toll pathway, mitochondrial [Hemicordylus capensis]XP_053151365.1 evolutionarily conserved signaling intermediate in Toll pathway, mitochondrial [Hemicordylus capensis]XP_053151366.1 evolutionarily conserved signaling intermediate in Toll pathway, mitochondrial [Hemicordylus capensis]XP_053151367.1 evolutionarily conserved sig